MKVLSRRPYGSVRRSTRLCSSQTGLPHDRERASPLRAGASVFDLMGRVSVVVDGQAALREERHNGKRTARLEALFESASFSDGQAHGRHDRSPGSRVGARTMPARRGAWAV